MHIPIALLIATQHNWWAAVLLVVFGLFDTLDGELARLQDRVSIRGRLLDSVSDRMKEVMLYSGAAYAIITTTGRPYLSVWAVVACGCSLLTSYVNAAGDSIVATQKTGRHNANKAFRGGLLPFEIRMAVLLVGLLSNRIPLAIIVIALGAAYTAVSRLYRVLIRLGEVDAAG
jgi:phosphatidylglycerophosphate synthase